MFMRFSKGYALWIAYPCAPQAAFLGCGLRRIDLLFPVLIPVKSRSTLSPQNVGTIFEEVFDDDNP